MLNNKKFIVSIVMVVSITCYFVFRTSKSKFNLNDFDTEIVQRGDLQKTITANGTINPVNVISVGSQVSGIIERIFVDFNTSVKKNQLLASLDISVLEKSVSERREAEHKAKTALDYAQSIYNKDLKLYQNDYISGVELYKSEIELKNAKSNYKIAVSQLETAKINLDYAFIKSPVSGVVISREVDVGQTVAASFSAPTLFKVAKDLTKMQIETSISEADIGSIKEGLEVQFSVDSYPSEKFYGKIEQVRLNPKTDSNVVVYTVVINTPNKDKRLMPGMTAYVNIPVENVKDVLKVNVVALRFNPDDSVLSIMGVEKPNRREGYSIIYKIDDKNKVTPVYVKRGLSNLSQIEIMSDNIGEGDKILTNSILIKNKK